MALERGPARIVWSQRGPYARRAAVHLVVQLPPVAGALAVVAADATRGPADHRGRLSRRRQPHAAEVA